MKTRKSIMLFTLIFSFLAANAWAIPYSWWRIPHLAYGGGYTSYVTIRDPNGIASRQIWVYLYDDNGALLPATVVDVNGTPIQVTTSNFSFSFALSAQQEKTFAITGTAGQLKTGWVQIAGEGIGLISASLRFTVTDDSSGRATDVVGILPADPNFSWTVSVEKRSSTDYTGIAVANPWTKSFPFTIDFYQNGSRVPGTVSRTFTLPASGHFAKFAHEAALFGGTSWDNFNGIGTLRISSTVDTFSAVALRGDGTQYSSLPADVGAQLWNMTYTDSTGTQNCTWTWRTTEGYTFAGYEQNPFNDDKVRLRGVYASDLTPPYFLADWNYQNPSDNTQGVMIFQGTMSKDGSTDVITGRKWQYKNDGTVVSGPITFTARRVY